MKTLVLLASLLAPLAAKASLPVLNCHNGATGAEFSIGYYADHTYFLMNGNLADVLSRQGARDVSNSGGDGAVIKHEGNAVSFTAPLREGTLSLYREDAGYRLRVVQGQIEADFYFNHGECRE